MSGNGRKETVSFLVILSASVNMEKYEMSELKGRFFHLGKGKILFQQKTMKYKE